MTNQKSGVAEVQELQNETAAFRSVDGDDLHDFPPKRKLQLLPFHFAPSFCLLIKTDGKGWSFRLPT
jgi:hypothetical protein